MDSSQAQPLGANRRPLVSIVVPAYNHGRYVAQAVQSVLSQDYANLELIVIDDGSTDDTAHVLAGLGGNFRWESQDNQGQAITLSKGWDASRGEVLGYLSADDLLEPSAVSEAVALLSQQPNVAATYSDYYLIDPHSRRVRKVSPPSRDFRTMLREVVCPPGPGAFFRRSVYMQVGPWNGDLHLMPDYDFWLRVARHGPIARIPKPLANFRVHQLSQTYSLASSEAAQEPIIIVTGALAQAGSEMLTNPGDDLRAMANAHLIGFQLHVRAGRMAQGFDSLVKAWHLNKRAVVRLRTVVLLLNASLNRIGHRILWTIRSLLQSRP